jgi:hypothetical protein
VRRAPHGHAHCGDGGGSVLHRDIG